MPNTKVKPTTTAITGFLKKEVLSGRWNPDQPISTDKELAQKFGVSRSTIVKSLAQLQQEGYIWSKQGKGRFVHKNTLKASKSWNIGLVIADMSQLTHPVVTKRLAGIYRVLESTQYHLQIFAVNQNSNQQLSFNKDINISDLDGMIICTQPLSLDEVDNIASEIPLVWIDPPTDNPKIGAVNLDLLGGAFLAGKHLVELGHTNISLITADTTKFPVIKTQEDGLRLATMNNINENRGHYTVFTGDTFSVEQGRLLAKKMLQSNPRPTAVVCGSDELAVGVYEVIKSHGLNVPEDISLIAWNDSEVEKQIPVPLTAVAIDYEEVGKQSIETLLSKINNPKQPFKQATIPMKLVVRKSTTPPKHNTLNTIV